MNVFKKLLMFLIAIIAINPVLNAQDPIIVSGAGDPVVNDTYNFSGNLNSRPGYTGVTSVNQEIYWSGTQWEIIEFFVTVKYSNSQDAALPPPTGWVTEAGGTAPAPTLSGGVLPVELTFFSAQIIDGSVKLLWQTATEINNYGFEIERKIECLDDCIDEWLNVGFIEGHGNSNSPKSYEYVDADPPAGNLEYRLKQIDTDGTLTYYNTTATVNTITGVKEKSLPEEFSLSQNYPNPFNPSTTIAYSIPVVDIPSPAGRDKLREGQHVSLKIYDILGKEVAELVNKQQQAGYYSVTFNANNLVTGLYIYRLTAKDFVQTRKMLLVK